MKLSTPDGLYPSAMAVSDDGVAYVLAHPVADGPVDVDRGAVFSIQNSDAAVLRTFDAEITGLATVGETLLVVDGECDVYLYEGGIWRDYTGIGEDVDRINAVRTVGTDVLGVASDGLIYRWSDGCWTDLVDETEDLYLYDIVAAGGDLFVSGECGHFSKVVGRGLEPIDVPLGTDLSCLLSMEDGHWLLTGWSATALYGSPGAMLTVDPGGRTSGFANAVVWKGKALVAATEEVLELRNGQLVVFSEEPALRLASAAGQLWRQWSNGVARFDGNDWLEIPLAATF